ncbi:DUF397 domain-containing protein [Saccharopolyspora indica]|uniref:DUF397 domain-containing protein n=1 Tax=Saccharopolyspora indica TaxID=1229659 RepID=UPI0022EB29EB|nr:DUF397 domain-containing protein [Saccharopolyspora indica]MDA3644613.1 DUF397 domain-containing protein [Saccharopolyspora indica]
MSHSDNEIADANWFKSTRSTNSQGCVEITLNSPQVGVRDSKNPHGGVLIFTHRQWTSFVLSIR